MKLFRLHAHRSKSPSWAVPAAVLAMVYSSFALAEPAADGSGLNRVGSTAGNIPAAPAAAPKQNWREKSEASCGMACRYHRANDNLTLQALYLITKIKKIDESVQNGDDDKARTALGGFCTDASEAVGDCFNRYKLFQRVALLQIRQAIGKNEESIARLTSGRKEDGTVGGDTVSFAANSDPEAYVPEVPTVSELEKAYLDGKLKPAQGKYSAQEIQKWSQELVGVTPRNQRYLEFSKKTVEGNPHQTEKTKYQLHLVARDGNGVAKTDAAAVTAVQASQKGIKEVADGSVQLGKDARVITPKALPKDDSVSHAALTEARSILNSRIAGDLQKSEATRAPAGKKDSKSADTAKDGAKTAASPGAATPTTGTEAQDIAVKRGTASVPEYYRAYADEERVKMPEKVDTSRYIRYNLHDLFTDIEDSTK
jgi:hypothetical protein